VYLVPCVASCIVIVSRSTLVSPFLQNYFLMFASLLSLSDISFSVLSTGPIRILSR
jgi:hypothetical protein